MIAYDPFLTPERALDLGIEKVALDDLLARADFITLHTPLTDQTRNILSRANLAKTKKGVRIVNCARGGLIDEAALKEALESGHVAGAALDVFVDEPAKDNPLFGTPGLVATPHLGASTTEAQVNVAIQVAEQMSEFLTRGGVTNALNMPSLSAEEAPKLRPYMELAEKLGSLVGQLEGLRASARSRSRSKAPPPRLNQKPITGAVLAGMMRIYSDSVNMVNAPFLAKERGLDVREVRHDREGDYHTLVRVSVDHAGRSQGRPPGTLFANSGAAPGRLVRDQGRGRARRRDDLYRQRGRARLHRPARHHARRGGSQYRHLQPRPPRGGRRGGGPGLGRRPYRARTWSRKLETLPGVKKVKPLRF